MPRINDLNLNNWKEKHLIIFSDKYKIRKTYDINDYERFRFWYLWF